MSCVREVFVTRARMHAVKRCRMFDITTWLWRALVCEYSCAVLVFNAIFHAATLLRPDDIHALTIEDAFNKYKYAALAEISG